MSTTNETHIEATQEHLDAVEQALRDADDALCNIACADEEEECADEDVGRVTAALDTAEESLRKTRASFQPLCKPREATAT
jgi:hypothetical protein